MLPLSDINLLKPNLSPSLTRAVLKSINVIRISSDRNLKKKDDINILNLLRRFFDN